jgi:hypothetical protein
MFNDHSHINDNSKPLILLGTNSALADLLELCQDHDIKVHGIIDKDYYGNTEFFCNIPIIDTEESFEDLDKAEYYRNNFNFFCVVSWTPENLSHSERNRNKRQKFINLIYTYKLNCISILGFHSRLPKSVSVGRGVFIDNLVNIEPRVDIHDFVSIYGSTLVGHDSIIEKNCVFQRCCLVTGLNVYKHDTYFSPMVKALKSNVTFGEHTFVKEGIYIRRGTVPHEVVSLNGPNLKKIISIETLTMEGSILND